MKELFMLDPDVVFLNHGSFGATSRPVFQAYQRWQAALERQPVRFLATDLAGHLAAARASLGNYVNADQDDLVYIPNATFGVNVVARSLRLGAGDEVLTTNHEYGACRNVWQFLSHERGFHYKQVSISLPIISAEAFMEELWRGVTPQTRVIFVSHITSPTACEFPVQAVCSRAREAGILTVVDGAHAPGQIPLDVAALGADFYCGNAHKWLCAPKGSGFLYTRREQQQLIKPLVVGWGWGEERTISYGSDYLDYLQWLGTNDLSAYLAVTEAIRFQEEYDWPDVRRRCYDLLKVAVERICALTGLNSLYLHDEFRQMAIAPLPKIRDLQALKTRIYEEYRIEVPLIEWQGQHFIRISVQAYNAEPDIDALVDALKELLPVYRV